MISIVGGTYAERCRYPAWDQIYGSGLRAAIAASTVSSAVALHSYVPREWMEDVEATLASFGVRGKLTTSDRPITFGYLHAFQPTEQPDPPNTPYPDLIVSDEVVLRFGMIEGDARVAGQRVVYDPQIPNASFHANGSKADRLAMIMTGQELLSLAPPSTRERLKEDQPRHMPDEALLSDAIIAQRDLPGSPQVVLVKDGLGGLLVFHGDQPVRVPSYAAESFFRIGSGDVIAAAFAHSWGELQMDAVAAADYAARCAAYFVEGPRLPLPTPTELSGRARCQVRKGDIRIVGVGDFELQTLVLTTHSWLSYLGGTVKHTTFEANDWHAVSDTIDMLLVGSRGTRKELDVIARADVRPSVVFWPGAGSQLAMDYFPDAVIARDYATALYHVMRSPER
jgi:hypothetical protein